MHQGQGGHFQICKKKDINSVTSACIRTYIPACIYPSLYIYISSTTTTSTTTITITRLLLLLLIQLVVLAKKRCVSDILVECYDAISGITRFTNVFESIMPLIRTLLVGKSSVPKQKSQKLEARHRCYRQLYWKLKLH